MKISYNWLQQFITLKDTPEESGKLLTDLGLEVEGIDTYESIPGSLEGIVVGEVLSCISHPNADRLRVTTVALGEGETVQIVCGAPNVAAGQKVPVATIGTTLYTSEGESWTIKKGKIRGEESHGMICAEDEIGLGTGHEGILVLDTDAANGTPLSELFPVEKDFVFEIGLTPNRADAMSHWGVARDLAAGLEHNGKHIELDLPPTRRFQITNRSLKMDVRVADAAKAPRYCGVTLSGVRVTTSPDWLRHRLESIGVKPINTVVDITNYVLHGLGQPLHAFDAAKITTRSVHVKTLSSGTPFVTLDGTERTLHEEDLMICDTDTPLCLAGVYGGLHSGITETTTDVFLESAYFDPVTIRKTAKRHGLNTDASFRYERGIDPSITEYALQYAVLLIQQLSGGVVSMDSVDLYPHKIEDKPIYLSFDQAAKLIGERLSKEKIKNILFALEIKITNETESGLSLVVPSYRNDVTREVDVIEEIVRVYGYNRIQTSDKLAISVAPSSKHEDYKIQNKIADQLVALGFYEMMSNSLTSPAHHANQTEQTDVVTLLNPLSNDLSVLRTNLLFSGLEAIAYNLNHQQDHLQLFEFGKSYHHQTGTSTYEEKKYLSLFISRPEVRNHWISAPQSGDFYYSKGVIMAILERLGFGTVTERYIQNETFAEGLSFATRKVVLAECGWIHKDICTSAGINKPVAHAILYWDRIREQLSITPLRVQPIAKYPQVRRDFALLLREDVTFEELRSLALRQERKLLKDVTLFDVYQGKNLPEGKKSYALSFMLQDENKTLTDKQIDKVMKKLQQQFETVFEAELR